MTGIYIVHGSTFDELGQLKNVEPSHIVCDPPFSKFVHANLRGNKTDQTKIVQRRATYSYLTAEDRWARAQHWMRHGRGWVVWFSDWESVGHWRACIEAAGGVFARAVPWVRWSKPANRKSAIPSGSEAICFAHRKGVDVVFNGRGRTHYSVKCLRHQSKESTGYHGQKPVELMVEVLNDIVRPGTRPVIIDDHAGTGSTLMAARMLGLDAVGIEVDVLGVQLMTKRIAEFERR